MTYQKGGSNPPMKSTASDFRRYVSGMWVSGKLNPNYMRVEDIQLNVTEKAVILFFFK